MITITIVPDESWDEDDEVIEGFQYNIYEGDIDEDLEAIDGGFCTGSMEDAISMASEQARKLIVKESVN